MEKGYVLRLYDTDLLSFILSERGIEGLKAQIHSVNEEARALFPLDLELAVNTVKEVSGLDGVKAVIFKSPCIAVVKPTKRCRRS